MRLLMLCGVNCTAEIWAELRPLLKGHELHCLSYPHEVTSRASSPDDLTAWVHEACGREGYDAVIGHSLGGVIALQLAADYGMPLGKIIFLDTNLRPAEAFYRNLMTPAHMAQRGADILAMLASERPFCSPALLASLQKDFDYTPLLRRVAQPVYAVYGDRGAADYPGRIRDLNLPDDAAARLRFRFVPDCCHMLMVENPQGLAQVLRDILGE